MSSNSIVSILAVNVLLSISGMSMASSNSWSNELSGGWNEIKNVRDFDRLRDVSWLSAQASKGNPWAQFYLGVYYARKETPEGLGYALPLLRDAAYALPSESSVVNYHGWVELLNGNYSEAIQIFSTSASGDGQQEISGKLNLAHALLLSGDDFQAKELYSELFEKKWISPNKITTMGVTDLKIFKYLKLCDYKCDQQVAWFNQSYDNTRTKWIDEW